MGGIDIAVRICPGRCDAYTVVIVRNDILETILFTVTFQRRNQTLALESFLGNLFKLGKQLALELRLQCLPLSAHTQRVITTVSVCLCFTGRLSVCLLATSRKNY